MVARRSQKDERTGCLHNRFPGGWLGLALA